MDTGFHHEQALSSALNRHTISFQSSAMDSSSEMILMGNYYGMNSCTGGITFSGNANMVNTNSGNGNASTSLLLDSIPGLKRDTGLVVEWSVEEQYKLEEGLAKYAAEPSIMRYIKIAATLGDKTVRDVALRCRWISRKRRKHEELNLGKKVKDKKDKLIESSSKSGISSASPLNMALFSIITNNQGQSDNMHFEALCGTIRQLLEQNNQVLGQISTNISALKIQDNLNLFSHIRNNISAILNDMRCMPGPPLPVSIDEELANTLLPSTSQIMMFSPSSGMHMKQEPRY